jgi:two-component system, chemotaxis family, protein-glutamate methylesterase/glutaminase
MNRVRVLVVEDSLTIRRSLVDILSQDSGVEVVGEAENGKRAIELCMSLKPDVITMDMVMPVMSGLAATEYIMAYLPTPILIVSSSLNRGEVFKTYDALAAGALDVYEKPSGEEIESGWGRRFIATIKLLARIKVIMHPRARLDMSRGPAATLSSRSQAGRAAADLIVIGASTGGPAAIVTILKSMPRSISAPILFALHIDEPFAASFAEWLDAQTPHPVAYARDLESLEGRAGCVLMAPPGLHLVVAQRRCRLTADPPRHSCRPSIDVLFESVAQDAPRNVIACLLTGMGRDGATGLLAVRKAGGCTIAQDQASSVVYGMPREAALIDAAQQVLSLADIGPAIVQQLNAPFGMITT